MSISSVGAASGVEQAYSIAMARKSLDAQQAEGKNAVALIQSAAATPLRPGHQLSVVL